ncbi:TolC family protein [Schlesneria sp.]|uniref:TolC family protein n=1 Tax=Schlesneria sp. TaxID=2762018 RepID=UPI002F08F9BB
MRPGLTWRACLGLTCVSLIVGGCMRHAKTPAASSGVDTVHYAHLAHHIEVPEGTDTNDPLYSTPQPISLTSLETQSYVEMSLEEAMQHALANSKVMKDLGATVLRAPDTARSVNDPSLVETDGRYGIEAALSAFDAQFTTNASVEHNNRALNNVFFGGGTRLLRQDFSVWQTQLSKTSATGTQFAVKNYTQYDANNAPGNAFPSAFTTWMDMEVKHPLLQGAGTRFNRIAGPNAVPGFVYGVVIARINTDVALADFEIGVRNFISDVENAYWDLYFAYRDLDAKVAARNAALETWRTIEALGPRKGGEAQKEAQAREQYYRFQEDAQNALSGKLMDGTRNVNGSSGGTFRGTGGVFVAERRLRLLIGLPISDGSLIRPCDEPLRARIEYNWDCSLMEALTRRAELRRQKWQIKKREAELEANKNFLLPQLNLSGRYRWRGFGNDLFPNGGSGQFNNAVGDLVTGDFQEWQTGVELTFPIGFRRAYAAVRHAELQLARERQLLFEQERYIVYDLSNSISEVERAYTVVETNFNRRNAAAEQLAAVKAAFEAENATLDTLLDAQRRQSDADTAFYRSLVEYQLAIKNVQLEKGTLLDYNDISLNEGPWPDKAYEDAADREAHRGLPEAQPLPWTHGPIVSEGNMIPSTSHYQVSVPAEAEESHSSEESSPSSE